MPPSLSDFQQQVRDAVVSGNTALIAPLLHAAGRDSARRAEIHRRHYHTSLVAAVMNRFPASSWLLGSAVTEAAAMSFVCAHPPTAPCIAEYGDRFPEWLAAHAASVDLPCVESFATLDWQLGRLAVSADGPALTPTQMTRLTTDGLADAVVLLQSGTYYLRAGWPVDALMGAFLGDPTQALATIKPQMVWLEARGNRGAISLTRLREADWVFRSDIHKARPVGVAAERAWQVDAQYDPGRALATMCHESLIAGLSGITGEGQ